MGLIYLLDNDPIKPAQEISSLFTKGIYPFFFFKELIYKYN